MVIVNIQGGLGNQMFQYAAGLSLAHHHQTCLKLFETNHRTDTLRELELQKLNTTIDFANQIEVDKLNPKNKFSRILQKLIPSHFKSFYKEKFFHYDNDFYKTNKEVYLKGYWQSEKYFKNIESLIRSQFTFKEHFNESIETLANSLCSENSVSIHIRRGDYLSKEVQEYHGILPLSYYYEAIKIIIEKIENPLFYIFTDDPRWVKENFYPPVEFTMVSGLYSATSIEDLYLMSACKNNIIANSSFSWWGAWLNSNAQKIVIAPKKWFDKGPQDTDDIIPETWIKL